ncbi:MAG: hypothetical protein QOF40_1138, partial [Actinomycetota bacterium]|nr:hypothetical protein [Actinomycetota bacterium]
HLANDMTAVAICEPIHDGNVVVGAIIRLRVNANDPSLPGPTAHLGWAALSGAERRVADLVAQGHTNREAAAALFLSRHTIDSHLRHIFAKLGIDSRAALARLTAEHSNNLDVHPRGSRKPTAG